VKDVNDKFEGQRLENAMTFHSLAGRVGSFDEEISTEQDEVADPEQDTDFTLKNATRYIIQDVLKDEEMKELVYKIFRTDKSGEESSPEYEEFINKK